MSRFAKSTRHSIAGALVVVAASLYVVTAPYERFPGVVIGGEPPPPADGTTVNDHDVVLMKLAGFPPFVIRIVYSTDDGRHHHGHPARRRLLGRARAGRAARTGGSDSATRRMR